MLDNRAARGRAAVEALGRRRGEIGKLRHEPDSKALGTSRPDGVRMAAPPRPRQRYPTRRGTAGGRRHTIRSNAAASPPRACRRSGDLAQRDDAGTTIVSSALSEWTAYAEHRNSDAPCTGRSRPIFRCRRRRSGGSRPACAPAAGTRGSAGRALQTRRAQPISSTTLPTARPLSTSSCASAIAVSGSRAAMLCFRLPCSSQRVSCAIAAVRSACVRL